MGPETDLVLGRRLPEGTRVIAGLIVETLGLEMTDGRSMARQAPFATRWRWMWISRRMPKRRRWRK